MDNNPLGQNWLLLRGLAREPAHWGNFIEILQAAFPHATVNTLALPGTGEHYQLDSPQSIVEITEFVRSQAHARGLLEQPATILALSLGAMVAWEWLIRYPGDCCGAALISTSFAGVSPFYQRLRWQSYGRLVGIVRAKDVLQREKHILQWVNNNPDNNEELAQQWRKIQLERPISPQTVFRQILAASTYRPSQHKPKPPVLLINSQGDRLVSPQCSVAIAHKWQLPLKTHPWAGHDLTVDDGNWLAEELKNWVGGLMTS